jgi:hypothetical protein
MEADIIFTSKFLEHLPDKTTLDKILMPIYGALKQGGHYLILGSNLRYLPGKYWDFYDHHLGLTHLSLTEALVLQRLEKNQFFEKFLPFTTKSALPTHSFFVSLYLKMPIAWRIFGSQFFIVPQRPA